MAFQNGCTDSAATVTNFACSQPIPAPLPADMPATAIAHAFDGSGFFNSSSSQSVDASLALIDAYLNCLGSICDAPAGTMLLGNGAGFDVVPMLSTLLEQLATLMADGQILVGSPAGVVASSLCDEIESCLSTVLSADGMVLMASTSGLVGRDFCAQTMACLSAGSDAGDFYLNIGGVLSPVSFSQYVAQELSGAALCTVVTDCLVAATNSGEVLYNDGTTITGIDLAAINTTAVVTSPTFCPAVLNCLTTTVGPGQVLTNVSGTLAGAALQNLPGFCGAVTACLTSVPISTFSDLCDGVFDCLDNNSANGEFFINQNGEVVATDFNTAVLAIAGSGTGGGTGTSFTCANVLPCLDALTGSGEILYDDGTGLAPTLLSSLLPAGTTIPSFTDLTDTPGAYAGDEGSLLVVNSAGTGLEFIRLFSGNGALSLSGSQVIPTGGRVSVEMNNVITLDPNGLVTNTPTGDFLTVTETGNYMISWHMNGLGFITPPAGGELVEIEMLLDFFGTSQPPITLQHDRYYYEAPGLMGVNFGGSGSIQKGLTAGTTMDLDVLIDIESGATYNFTMLEAHFSVYRVS